MNYMRKYKLAFYKPFKINGPRRRMWHYKFPNVSTVMWPSPLSGKLTVRQGKGKKDRILWLNEPVLEDLRQWRGRRPASANGLLFTTLAGRPIYASALRAMVKRRGNKAGLQHKDVHPHMLRHTFATELYRQTKDIRMVQKCLGHSDLSTTMIYTHIVDEDMEAALKRFHLG
jgi:integrase/recombinase XerD